MPEEIERRLQHLEAELAAAANAAFDVSSVHIAMMIALRAVIGRMPVEQRGEAAEAAIADAERQRNRGLAALIATGAGGKPLTDFRRLHDAVRRDLQRIFGQHEA